MNNKGFTLIELVVVISVVIVLVATGVTSLSQFYSRDKVVAARSEVVAAIRMAKNYAVTAQSPTGYAAQLDAVEVVLDNSKQLSVVPATTVGGVLSVGSSYSVTVMKDSEVQLTSNDGLNMIFSVSNGKLLNSDGTSKDINYVKTISISAEGTGETMVVNVGAMGVIGE